MPPELSGLPFLTRKMLDFEQATQIQLVITSTGGSTTPIYVTGATKSGVFTFKHAPNATYTRKSETFNLNDIPIWASVLDRDNVKSRGDLYCKLDLALNGDRVYQLTGGYVYGVKGISWPNTVIEPAAPFMGSLVEVDGTNPAAGAQISETIPTGLLRRIVALQFSLVTNATVANREVVLHFYRQGTEVLALTTAVAQAASLTYTYSWAAMGARNVGQTTAITASFMLPPDLWLEDGDQFTTTLLNGNAGDDFSSPAYLVEQLVKVG